MRNMKRRAVTVLAAITAIITVFTVSGVQAGTTPAPTVKTTPHPTSAYINYYVMEHSSASGVASGYVLDDPNNSTTNGTHMQLWGYNGRPQQLFVFAASGYGNGYGQLSLENGKCLDIPNDVGQDGTPIQIWTCLGNANQAWKAVSCNGSSCLWVNPNGYCLDDYNDLNTDGNKIQEWNCGTSDNSQYFIY